jgi:hypothetical protein
LPCGQGSTIPKSEDIGTADIIIAKNYEGPVGAFEFKFDGWCGNLEEINHGRFKKVITGQRRSAAFKRLAT